MANQVKFSDLFEGFDEGIAGLEKQISGVQTTLTNMLGEVKKKAEEMYGALQGVSSATKTDRDATSAYASEVERLHKDFEKLNNAISEMAKQQEGMRKSVKGGSHDIQDLSKSYQTLGALVADTGLYLDDLLVSEKALTQATKNGTIANNSLQGSYEQLYAQYNLIKIVLNNMGAEMRNNTKIGGVWETQALSIMNTLKMMQEATGKHTLSVGDYTKAFNGLNISTQQVLRELPTLANSWSQFFIAISNNVPIFVDNFNAVKNVTGSALTALKGVLKAVLSWQTVLLGVLTILPKVAKIIHEKRKAQEGGNKTTKEAITYNKLYKDALDNVSKAVTKSVSQLRTLSNILNDNTRSMEERKSAMDAIIRLYPDLAKNMSAEGTSYKDNKKAVDEYIESLKKESEAKSILSQIDELRAKEQEAERKRSALQTAYNQERLKQEADLMPLRREAIKAEEEYQLALASGSEDVVYLQKNARVKKQIYDEAYDSFVNVGEAVADAEKALRKWEEAGRDAKEFDKLPIEARLYEATRETSQFAVAIDGLTKDLDKVLIDTLGNTDKATKESLEKAKNYYWEFEESKAALIENELEREIRENDLARNKEIEGYKNVLETEKNLTEENQNYINGIILNLEEQRERERLDIVTKYLNKIAEETIKEVEQMPVVTPEDLLKAEYDTKLAEQSKKILASRTKLNDALENNSYFAAKKEGKIFKELTIEKLRIEAEYQKKLLALRLKHDDINQEQYDIELANIENNLAKSIAGLESGGRKPKFSIWNLLFGTTADKGGKGNIFKELDSEAKAFVDAFTQSMELAFQYMDEWMDKRIEMAEIAVEAAEKESEAAKTALDYEMQARANGYANNVELARKEYEEKLKLEQDAIAEKERLQKIQEAIDTATQFSSLVTATAELWAAHAGIPFVGAALAAVATAAMWASFAAAKITAAQMTSTKYGEGMSEYIDYGGSHASGNDVDFGADKRGRRRRVERGEVIGVINKRNVDKYGVKTVTDVINSLNKGTFEERYTLADVVAPEMNADLYHLAFAGLDREGVSLGGVESRLQTLIEQGETRVVPTADGRIEYRGNNKRIIHNS